MTSQVCHAVYLWGGEEDRSNTWLNLWLCMKIVRVGEQLRFEDAIRQLGSLEDASRR